MSIIAVPGRHLYGLADPYPRMHPWGMGASPRRARWSFGKLGQCLVYDETGACDQYATDDGSDTGTPVNLFSGSQGAIPLEPITAPVSTVSLPWCSSDAQGNCLSMSTGCPSGYEPDTTGNCIPSTSNSGGSSNWASALAAAFGGAAKVATVAVAPPGSYISPTGAVTLAPSAQQISASVSAYMPLILIGAAVLLVMSLEGKH